MMNNNILIDSARPKVLPEESERSSEDKACLGQKYKHNFGEIFNIFSNYFSVLI